MYVRLRGAAICAVLFALAACGTTRYVIEDVPDSPTPTAAAGHLQDLLLARQDLPPGWIQVPAPKARTFCGHTPTPAPAERADTAFGSPGSGVPTVVRAGLRRYASAAEARMAFENLRRFVTDSCREDRTPKGTDRISIAPGPRLGDGCFVITQRITLAAAVEGIRSEIGTTYYIRKDAVLVAVAVLGREPDTALLNRLARLQIERLSQPWGMSA